MKRRQIAAIRLEGGLGDHILGMRLIRFIHQQYPVHDLVVYSDCGGHPTQLEIARLSPYVTDVIPVYKSLSGFTKRTMWYLEHIEPAKLAEMKSADVFFDGALWSFFVPQARTLGVPYYDILATVPDIQVPDIARLNAHAILRGVCKQGPSRHRKYIGLNVAKYGADFLRVNLEQLKLFLSRLLEDRDVMILNMFVSMMEFPHWPEPERTQREAFALEECKVISELCNWSDRIIPIIDQPITTVAALIELCRYFIGVDNGVKHLAWALRKPHSLIVPQFVDLNVPDQLHHLRSILHWMPDFDRAVTLTDQFALETHARYAREFLAQD